MQFLDIHPDNPQGRKISQVVDALNEGAVIIYPTDTVYALGCAIDQNEAVDRISRIRKLDPKRARYSIICKDIAQASSYTAQMDNEVFRMMKAHVPGPFTFIHKAGSMLPKTLKSKRKSVGIRIPDNNIAMAILELMGKPILSASLYSEDEILEYIADPAEIRDTYANEVDYIIDGGPGKLTPSTVIDCTKNPPEIIRQGLGELR
ncbi:MAG: threonylcarbamoyl-AMP synthase [Bacteroidetes bacterium]|nr:threonylcarbamoyl-AMP synthase [Bacteroidota bacterium]